MTQTQAQVDDRDAPQDAPQDATTQAQVDPDQTATTTPAIDQSWIAVAADQTWLDAFPGISPVTVGKLRQFAMVEQELIDSKSVASRHFANGFLGIEILNDLRVADPSTYNRTNAIKMFDLALAMGNVPPVYEPSVLLKVAHVIRLYFSTVDVDGMRTFCAVDFADFCVGNISFASVKAISTLITRASKNDEMDVFEYASDGMATLALSLIDRLRSGHASLSTTTKAITDYKAKLKSERAASKLKGKSSEELAELAQREAASKRNRALSQLQESANKLRTDSMEECGMKSQASFEDFLRNVGVIGPQISPEQYALVMTPGDMKAILETLHVMQRQNVLDAVVRFMVPLMNASVDRPATLPLSKAV